MHGPVHLLRPEGRVRVAVDHVQNDVGLRGEPLEAAVGGRHAQPELRTLPGATVSVIRAASGSQRQTPGRHTDTQTQTGRHAPADGHGRRADTGDRGSGWSAGEHR